VMSRSPGEIARALVSLLRNGRAVRCNLAAGKMIFESRLLFVDPAHTCILIETGSNETATAALLARPHASFHASSDGQHIEFSAAGSRRVEYKGSPAIRLSFPAMLVTQQSRAFERVSVQPPVPLKFVADAGGPLSFNGTLVDISPGGFACLEYAPSITLEPGTFLKGCRIEMPGRPSATADLEVRYSRMISQPDGRHAVRSGCSFLNATPELKALLSSFFAH
jgi:c-di-GMP-binding flagellar brake protein YcgR